MNRRRSNKAAALLAALLGSTLLSPAFAGPASDRWRGGESRGRPAQGDRHPAPPGWTRCDVDRQPPPWLRHSRHEHRGWGPHRGTTLYYGWSPVPWGREFLGSIIGGATGAVLGSTIGRGAGNTAAIVGGTVLGAMVGGSVGRSMDASDRMYVTRTLEYAPSRQVVAWQNPDSTARYEVEPLATYERPDGRYCREYRTTALIGGNAQQIYGTACRQPDGSWEVVR